MSCAGLICRQILPDEDEWLTGRSARLCDGFRRPDIAMKKIVLPLTLVLTGILQGCSTGPQWFGHRDKTSCHEPGSDAWWAEKAMLPPGVRQQYKKGKIWPPQPRSNQEPQQFSHTYYAEHYWPLPYVCQDRDAVRSMMETQVALGWQEETTLYNRHFHEETQQLTRAGELHLEYILHVVPVDRRAVYIQSTYDTALDAMRTDAVNSVMSGIGGNVGSVSVCVRECQQVGRPAAEVQQINERYTTTTPSPRIGSASGGGGGGGGGGASGGN